MEDIHQTLGRIEQKIDNVCEQMDRHRDSVFGHGGIESRMRDVERDNAVIKAKAGIIATIVSAVVGLLSALFGQRFH